jgi:hypothetical protein
VRQLNRWYLTTTAHSPRQPNIYNRFNVEKQRGFSVENPRFSIVIRLLFGSRSVHGASVRASAAIDAGIRVDHILAVALRDRVHGAAIRASAASDAFISDNVSHGYTSKKFQSDDNHLTCTLNILSQVM